jgi:hypothetical protein
MAVAMADALRDRGVQDAVAAAAAELGVLAFREGYAAWTAADNHEDLGQLARASLDRLRIALTQLG